MSTSVFEDLFPRWYYTLFKQLVFFSLPDGTGLTFGREHLGGGCFYLRGLSCPVSSFCFAQLTISFFYSIIHGLSILGLSFLARFE